MIIDYLTIFGMLTAAVMTVVVFVFIKEQKPRP